MGGGRKTTIQIQKDSWALQACREEWISNTPEKKCFVFSQRIMRNRSSHYFSFKGFSFHANSFLSLDIQSQLYHLPSMSTRRRHFLKCATQKRVPLIHYILYCLLLWQISYFESQNTLYRIIFSRNYLDWCEFCMLIKVTYQNFFFFSRKKIK